MKLTKKQIDLIIKMTPVSLKGQQHTISVTLGYFIPSGANWSYLAGWTYTGDLVVTRFGTIQ